MATQPLFTEDYIPHTPGRGLGDPLIGYPLPASVRPAKECDQILGLDMSARIAQIMLDGIDRSRMPARLRKSAQHLGARGSQHSGEFTGESLLDDAREGIGDIASYVCSEISRLVHALRGACKEEISIARKERLGFLLSQKKPLAMGEHIESTPGANSYTGFTYEELCLLAMRPEYGGHSEPVSDPIPQRVVDLGEPIQRNSLKKSNGRNKPGYNRRRRNRRGGHRLHRNG